MHKGQPWNAAEEMGGMGNTIPNETPNKLISKIKAVAYLLKGWNQDLLR